ncbi:putative quinol monooxygenase [Larkinella humicola]|uniref:Antibiotic biosynthesis monooxygenase n=1 Tax=Larkinella humicola TaxID=2607654 RepID=A0A5N1JEH4_9BACT|nr:antibiotic biosynthesis monooxygenase family protein [Larkinella humicola]KAA9353515.1 antibiotic biosynthesis monooxygenase [Larkinella humicola]
MLIRIVRMTFQEAKTADFLAIFEASKQKIRAFPGCLHLELLRDLDQPTVYVTYSQWETPEALTHYRHSELFKTTWAATKRLFADRATAFSVEKIDEVRD